MPALSDTLSQLNLGGLNFSTVLSAALTALVGLIVIRVLRKVAARLLSRSRLDVRIQKYVLTAVKAALYVLLILIVMETLNVKATSLVALVSVFSLGLTLAAEDVLGNVAGGMVILSSRPFLIGDFIEAEGVSGTVEEIGLNHTKLLTPDGQLVMMPNRTLSSSKVTNYTTLGRRRVVRKVTASYDAPTDTVKAACRTALSRTAGVLADPEPKVWLTDYGASAIEYTVYCWSSVGDYWDVYFSLGENLRGAFAEAGVEMTYDHLNVHIVEQ